jgi:transcriptional regulator with XRE-family HTH domain
VEDYGGQVSAYVAQVFRDRRAELAWSLAETADQADLHRSTIHKVEQGRQNLTVAAAARLAKALGLRLSDVVADAERRLR